MMYTQILSTKLNMHSRCVLLGPFPSGEGGGLGDEANADHEHTVYTMPCIRLHVL